MSKKHRTQVPDFSSHKPSAKAPGAQPPKSAPVAHPAPRVKPPSTSSKSGRRGS